MFHKYIYIKQEEFLFIVLVWMFLTLYKNFSSYLNSRKKISLTFYWDLIDFINDPSFTQ